MAIQSFACFQRHFPMPKWAVQAPTCKHFDIPDFYKARGFVYNIWVTLTLCCGLARKRYVITFHVRNTATTQNVTERRFIARAPAHAHWCQWRNGDPPLVSAKHLKTHSISRNYDLFIKLKLNVFNSRLPFCTHPLDRSIFLRKPTSMIFLSTGIYKFEYPIGPCKVQGVAKSFVKPAHCWDKLLGSNKFQDYFVVIELPFLKLRKTSLPWVVGFQM